MTETITYIIFFSFLNIRFNKEDNKKILTYKNADIQNLTINKL